MNLEKIQAKLLPGFNVKAQPPKIDPVPEGLPRPQWSVMIPAYNCADYLRQTLESVLAQDPGPEQMQIEVVDDCSTNDETRAVVSEVGKGRVAFYRKPKNEGVTPNFNTCIQRSHGHLVHILHSDDYVMAGFYDTVGKALQRKPAAGIAIVRSFLVDECGEIEILAARAARDEGPHHSFADHIYINHMWTPGLVVRRSSYEKAGGFMPELPHVADWELTMRAYKKFGAVYINSPLSCYREFSNNHTGRLARTGENLRDQIRFLAIMLERGYDVNVRHFMRLLSDRAAEQAGRFQALGDSAAAAANRKLSAEINAILPSRGRRLLQRLTASILPKLRR